MAKTSTLPAAWRSALHRSRPRRPVPRRLARALALCAMLTLAGPAAHGDVPGLPTGLSTVAGQAQVSITGQRMTVVNTPQTILNWTSFSIGAGNSVYFQQANAGSQVLNRVTGNEVSSILGSLGSNGRVWLLNPNGVLFGASARVDVAGLVAGTLRLADADWLTQRHAFSQGLAGAAVVNQGELRSSFGGRVVLLGDSVQNSGLVQAPGGQIILAAGRSVELADTGAPNLGVRINAEAGAARNLGSLLAAGGRIDIHAAAVSQQGLVSADSLGTGPGGEVWILASQSADMAAGSRTSADGGSGGHVRVDSGQGRNTLVGQVSAQGNQGPGGEVLLLGRTLSLGDGSVVDASGSTGGGTVLVGGATGDATGGTTGGQVTNVDTLFVARQASIRVDALTPMGQQGNGGRIVLRSNSATRAFGSLSAQGGVAGGNGGSIETTGSWLDARPAGLNLSAPAGRAGSWLLGGRDISVSDSVGNIGFADGGAAGGLVTQIASASVRGMLDSGGSVTVSSTASAAQQGSLSIVDANLVSSAAAPGALRFVADGDISVLRSRLGSVYGPMQVELLAGRGGISGISGISLVSSVISTGGGDFGPTPPGAIVPGNVSSSITLGGFASGSTTAGTSFGGAATGIRIVDSMLNASRGRLSMRSAGLDLQASNSRLLGANIVLIGDSADRYGVVLRDNTRLNALQSAAIDGSGPLAGVAVESGASLLVSPVGYEALDAVLQLRGLGRGAGAVGMTITGTANAPVLQGDNGARVVLQAGTVGSSQPALRLTNAVIVSDSADQDLLVSGIGNSALAGLQVVRASGDLPVLTARNRRWVVFAQSPAGVDAAQLAYGFKRHGAAFGGWAGDAGNGLVYAQPQQASYALVAATRDYDRSTTAQLASSSVATIGGDVATLLPGLSISFADANAGLSKPLLLSSASPFSFGDAQGRPVYGYTQAGTATGSILPLALNVSGLSAQGKVYDAGTTATVLGSATVTPLYGDNVGVQGRGFGAFTDKNVGNAKPVALVGYSLVGADAGNYSLSSALQANITPLALTLAGLQANSKFYDASMAATLSGTATVRTLAGDQLSLAGSATAAFADKNVANGKTVVVSGLGLAGADAGNYRLAPSLQLSADITPRPVAISGLRAVDKVYDGSSVAPLAGIASVQALPGDNLALTGSAAARFGSSQIGSGKSVSVSGLALSGDDAGNYSLVAPSGLQASIAAATLIYVADIQIRPVGQALNQLTGSVSGFVASESQASATVGNLLFASAAAAGSPPGRYAIVGSGLSAANYVLLQADSNSQGLVILPTTPPPNAILVNPAPGSQPPLVQPPALPPGGGGVLEYNQPPTPIGLGQGASPVLPVGSRAGVAPPATSPTGTLPATTVASGIGRGTAPGDLDLENLEPPAAGLGILASGSQVTARAAGAAYDLAFSGTSRLRLSSLSDIERQILLARREAFMDELLSDAVSMLEDDPSLADLRECESLEEARKGGCLVTLKLKSRLAAGGVVLAFRPQLPVAPVPPVPSVSPNVSTAPAAPTVAPGTPATAGDAASPASATAAAASADSAPTVVAAAQPRAPVMQLQSARRTVRQAALPQIERKVALVIGVGRYSDGSIPSLNNAVNDAVAVARIFEQRLGYEAVVLRDATRQDVVAALNELALTLQPRDSVLIYYAGHGEVVPGTKLGYWLLADSQARQPAGWLSNTDISRLMSVFDASQVALISDSCYSGSLVSEERIRAVASALDPQQVLNRKSVVVMSSGGNEPVFDDGHDGHSPFAFNLMKSIGQVANWQPGGNVFERVRFAVARVLPQRPQYSASRASGHQPGGDYLFEQRQLEALR